MNIRFMQSVFLGCIVFIISCSGDDFLPDLEVSTLVSELPANDAVSIDKKGTIYVSEFGQFDGSGGSGTRVFQITPDGQVVPFVTELKGPLGNITDRKGNLYVVDGNNGQLGQILKIAPDGTRTTLATIAGWPAGLAMDHQENLYVSNYVLPVVHKITPDGTINEYANDPILAGGVGIDFDRKKNLIVGNFNTGAIAKIDPEGDVTLLATLPDVINGFTLGYLTVVGNTTFATGIGTNKIYKVTPTGVISVFAGNGEAASKDGSLLEASFHNPNGIGYDDTNKILYISEFGGNGALRKIDLRP